MPLFRRLGDIELQRSNAASAHRWWIDALTLYERIPDSYSVGGAHHRLARIAAGAERRAHLEKARQAWRSIKRDDLVADLDGEFGDEPTC